jgi:hypothetical protein
MQDVAMQDINEWLQVGVTNKWVSPAFCNTHDGDPYMTEEEEQEWNNGGDPCMFVIKVLDV